VHRDVKGANILVDSDGRVMVSDFGVALRSSDVTLTADGTVIGTPPFTRPEQCAGRRAGPQSDQYSLGIVAFQILAGSVPFHADTLAGVMHHHFFTPVPDLTLVRDDLPAHLLDVVRRALNKDPDRRFKTTRDMLTAIEATAFSERDRQKSERALHNLVQGRAVKKITTRGLPPLAEMPTRAAPRSRPAACGCSRRLPPRRSGSTGVGSAPVACTMRCRFPPGPGTLRFVRRATRRSIRRW